MVSVLLTRPAPSSALLALKLHALGYQTALQPLLTITPLLTAPPDLSAIQAVMITSANALHALQEQRESALQLFDVPCFCVGSHTAKAAEVFGFRFVRHTAGDGAALALLITQSLRDKKLPVLHLAGRDLDRHAQDGLRRAGFMVLPWVVYAAETVSALDALTVSLLKRGKLDAVLFFSVRTAETWAALMTAYALGACCERLIAIGLSEAVMGALTGFSWRRLMAAPVPRDDGVIACLQDVLPIS